MEATSHRMLAHLTPRNTQTKHRFPTLRSLQQQAAGHQLVTLMITNYLCGQAKRTVFFISIGVAKCDNCSDIE